MKDFADMTPDEVRAEVHRRADRRRQGLPLRGLDPDSQADGHTPTRIAEEDNRLEKEIQREVVKLYLAFNCLVYNLSQARASKQSPGLADLYVVHTVRGRAWWHETKTPTGRQSPAQREFQNIHRRTVVGFVVGGVRAAEEHLIQLMIAQRGPDGELESPTKAEGP